MNNTLKNTAIIALLVLTIFSLVGCGNSGDESYIPPFQYQIKSDKATCGYGEEITLELLFKRSDMDETDGYTYCVELKKSSHYEIIGDSQVVTTGSETAYNGEYADFWYRAEFKIRVTEVNCGTHTPEITVKCIDNDWLEKEVNNNLGHTDDGISYNLPIHYTEFAFTSSGNGVELMPLYSTITPTPWWKSLLKAIFSIVNRIYYLITGKAMIVC